MRYSTRHKTTCKLPTLIYGICSKLPVPRDEGFPVLPSIHHPAIHLSVRPHARGVCPREMWVTISLDKIRRLSISTN